MEYVIWCDESVKRGDRYSNFYGGALVRSTDLNEVVESLEDKKEEQNLFSEIKWTKITENYEEKYKSLMTLFFHFMREGKVKTRIMFTDNALVPVGITKEQRDNEFFLLYYQFVKHAFGLTKVIHPNNTKLRINFDKIPDKKEKADEFKDYIFHLRRFLKPNNIGMLRDGISEVSSHDHVVLQCLDVVLGAMAFRLNRQHQIKPPGARIRGKKTRAKERVYMHINSEIQNLYPDYRFNIGISTGRHNGVADNWHMPYRHWCFKSRNSTYDSSRKK